MSKMNLYLISRPDAYAYGEYDAAVVAAASEEDARYIHPSGVILNKNAATDDPYDGSWILPKDVRVTYLGQAKEGTKRGVICASYNA
jgi:hypothetical protein